MPKLKCQRTEISPNFKCHPNWIVTKTEMPLNLKYITKTELLPKIICHQFKMSPKLKCHQHHVSKAKIATKTEVSQNIKMS